MMRAIDVLPTKESSTNRHSFCATHHYREELNWRLPEVQLSGHVSEYEFLLLNNSPNHASN